MPIRALGDVPLGLLGNLPSGLLSAACLVFWRVLNWAAGQRQIGLIGECLGLQDFARDDSIPPTFLDLSRNVSSITPALRRLAHGALHGERTAATDRRGILT